MRVENKDVNEKFRLQKEKIDRVAKTPTLQQNFQDVLQEQKPFDWQKRMDLLLANLDEVSKRLANSFSIYDLIEYKNILKNFLHESLTQLYGLKEETGWTRGGRPKLYQCIEVLNQELEELTKLVLQQQKEPIKLLKKLDTIRGLLVDLYS